MGNTGFSNVDFLGPFFNLNWAPILPGELKDTKVAWRWFTSANPFFNPFTDQTMLDVLSANERETLINNTAIYTFLPVSISFDIVMILVWLAGGITYKVVTQLGGFDYMAWLRRFN